MFGNKLENAIRQKNQALGIFESAKSGLMQSIEKFNAHLVEVRERIAKNQAKINEDALSIIDANTHIDHANATIQKIDQIIKN